ncbi:hypothetical protein IHQ56_02560 [Methylobacillus flagellatus]|uniref:hypothetical protein n=1 Tax=Methylobacillus flagellatus TaxID=405 RepID=UPI0028538F06|nr:hypothetical protein [Methylobacillus flagellatus]MDR5170691.1 hypothetical protein [Methylobacillus flagellatus]
MRSLLAFALLAVAMLAHADTIDESKEEARQRQQVEAIRQYERSGHREPFGGERERLGNPPQPIPNDAYEDGSQLQPQRKQYDWQKR